MSWFLALQRHLLPRFGVTRCHGLPHCGSAFARTISPREWRAVQAEELERNAAVMDFPDCADCEPEAPCAVHGGK